MEIAIITVLCVSLLLNLVLGIFLVRFRERTDNLITTIGRRVDGLARELTLRLPPRPYGVDIEEREADLTMGPIDWRQPR